MQNATLRLTCSAIFFLALLTAGAFTAPAAHAQADGMMASPVAATSTEARAAGGDQRQRLRDQSLVGNLPFRNVGPTVMSGRVVDVDASPADPTHFYVAYASGGLWRTRSNGTRFEPLFDDQSVMTLGDIAVDWDHGEVIWAGTGENNASRSSYAGDGIYKSTDGGATWQHMGLEETQRTGRIILHPDDPNTVWVAAAGALYSPSEARGVYKTTDGGATWQKTLYVDDNTGAIDLVIDPTDPNVLYAAMWERTRRAWDFVEGGPGSGIYKSTDGGATWALVSGDGSGFPTGEGVGRIGLAVYPGDTDVLYAFLDNQDRRPEEEEDEDAPALTRDMIRGMNKAAFLAVAEDALEDYLESNGFPASYTAKSILAMVRNDEIQPIALVEYLEDANADLFNTPVVGAEVYRSDDGGRSWQRTHDGFLDDIYYSYGYYFGEIRVAPHDADRIYIMGVPILKSTDGGQTFMSIDDANVHSDHHALWVSPTRPGHLINGNDGGLNISYDDGATWDKVNVPSVGQFYAVQYDMAEPYRVYGGLQDNGVWVGPSTYEASTRWWAEGQYPYERILGGDGMQVEVDTRTNDIVYTGFQFGNYTRLHRDTGDRAFIKPRHELGERPLRFNWNTPIHLSRHNQDILYYGANRLYRSLNRGNDFEPISPDLTQGGRAGNVPYGTLSTIDESPLRFGVLYAGSDDGLIHVSRDGGTTWTRITDGLPEDLWVSRVEASHHDPARVYASLNGYRWDHFDAYVYRSDDYGQTWRRIGTDLPAEPVNVVTEDPHNEDVVYVGTDHGVYLSLDGGETFMAAHRDLPNAPVHDLKVQPVAKDLIVGTHGRSIYIADVGLVEQLTTEFLAKAVHVFDLEDVTYRANWGDSFSAWGEPSEGEVEIPFYSATAGTATIRVKAADGTVLQEMTDAAERGLNYVAYHLTADPARAERYMKAHPAKEGDPEMTPADNGSVYLIPGTYTVEVSAGGGTATETFEVKAPRRGGRRGLPMAVPQTK